MIQHGWMQPQPEPLPVIALAVVAENVTELTASIAAKKVVFIF